MKRNTSKQPNEQPNERPNERQDERQDERQKAAFLKKIARKSQRKLNARQSPTQIWLGMRMFGLVGWAVSVPTLLGITLGVWLDQRSQSQYSWTLMMLLMGLGLGCFNAWYWIDKEGQGR